MLAKLLLNSTLLVLVTLVAGCSSHGTVKDEPRKYRVENIIKEDSHAALSDDATSTAILDNIKVDSVREVTYVKRSPPVSYEKPRMAVKPRLANNKLSQNILRTNELKGDYSKNPHVISFISMMVNKHNFNREHLNYVFSKVKLTPFLKRIAYKDAFGSKDKAKKKPRSGRWNRYRGNFLTNTTINKGIQFWRANRMALQQAELLYGVPQEYILGIIGVETRYGENVGKNRAIDALSAMGFENPRRGKYFRGELESYLLMTRSARLDPLKPKSSYAGALGLSQFMPSNISKFGVDHDRNGSVNLWTSPDAIASIANYFKKHGWRTGGTVAVKARSRNSKYRTLKTGFKSSHSLTRLKSRGISTKNIGNISGKASLIKLNTYSGDELWLGGHNFYVITRYNHSSHYAMAVHQLAQEIKKRIKPNQFIRQASLN